MFTPAYLTWDKEANEIEDRLRAIWDAQRTGSSGDLRHVLARVESDLHRLEIAYEEWEVFFREFLLVQHEVLDTRHVGPGSLAPTLAAGIVVAAPHLARAAEALEQSLEHIRNGAKDTPKRTWLSAVAALLTSRTARAGTKRRQIRSRDRDRRQAA